MTKVIWKVAGDRGMELHGYFGGDSKPSIVVRVNSMNWDFTFDGLEGSGRVRVGAGCEYNPLQMVEAMWGVMLNHDDDIEMPEEIDKVEWRNHMEGWE
jgi:hypothetical protein